MMPTYGTYTREPDGPDLTQPVNAQGLFSSGANNGAAIPLSLWQRDPSMVAYLQRNNLMGGNGPAAVATNPGFYSTTFTPSAPAPSAANLSPLQQLYGTSRQQGQGLGISREQEALNAYLYGSPGARAPMVTRNGVNVYRSANNPQGNLALLQARVFPNEPRYNPNAGMLQRLRDRAAGPLRQSLADMQGPTAQRGYVQEPADYRQRKLAALQGGY